MFMGRNMTHKKTKKTLLPKRSSGLPSIIGFSNLYSKLLLPNSSSIRPCNQSYKVERIKYKLTITSFEEDLNDVNKINAFMHFKSVNNDTTTTSAFVGLDSFITAMPKKDNEYNHGDSPYNVNEYNSNNNNIINNTRSVSSNGVDGYYFKKNSYQKTNDDYYFIYVVDEKCFYKKAKPNTFTKNKNNVQSNKKNYILFNKIAFDDIYETSSLSSLSNNKLRHSHSQGSVSHSNNQSFNNNTNSVFNNNNNNNITTIQNNTTNINNVVQPSSTLITSTLLPPFQTQTQIRLLRAHSPKQKVNVKCIPIKILENFYDI
jgi:hypothetical protein